ncbi:hypothetical protein AMAG_09462 [Allomyces macrogynus ATCC 38327]|uniref:Uncharacterized protein n=1 Tax=Allomyces macrogynus (strain ATCC 38327) TaxID=578462 RepID=A0A0L0SPZ6_ALLM3|nr:hypothetical protein AMAG_09462 [Allomyces macrogynus ATCC 38327]|eukprot:KNE64440.1 hypothetical protein AMAG_09462 [Allomyces macrogynus ATCC 38327]
MTTSTTSTPRTGPHGPQCGCASHAPTVPSVYETLDELEWARSLHGASASGDFARVKAKLSSSAHTNINALDEHGYSPLHYASRQGHVEIVRALCAAGANPNIGPRGGTQLPPLHRAVLAGSAATARVLREFGACVAVVDGEGRTARDVFDEEYAKGRIKRVDEWESVWRA